MHNPTLVSVKNFVTSLIAIVIAVQATAAEPVEVARGHGNHQPEQPQVSIDPHGTIHLVYGVEDSVRYHRSDDGGKTFAKPVELSFAKAMSLGMRRGPRIVATDKAICIVAIGGKQGKGKDGDLLAMHSTDGGKTWTGPVAVNDEEGSGREGLHALAAGPKGEFCCVWLDLRNGSTEIMASTSADGGKTWSKNILVYASPDGSVCECCHPSVTFDGRGRLLVQWRNSLAGNRDIYVTASADGGKTFSKATKLGTGTWKLGACPMDGGAISTSGDQIYSAWRRDKTVYLVQAGKQGERSLGDGEQPWIAATKDGPYVAWVKKRGEEGYVAIPGHASPTKFADHATDPVIAAGPAGGKSVVVAWESRHGQDGLIFVRRVAD